MSGYLLPRDPEYASTPLQRGTYCGLQLEPPSGRMTDFISFKGAFSGDLFTPADPGYDDVIGQWTTSLVKRPKIVAFVKNANDIILAIDFAKVNNLPVSVRRG